MEAIDRQAGNIDKLNNVGQGTYNQEKVGQKRFKK